MKARIGIAHERWDGVEVLIAHVIPLDTEAALADAAAKRFGDPNEVARRKQLGGETFPTLCGERTMPHFSRPNRHGYTVPLKWWWCATCQKLDAAPRLP